MEKRGGPASPTSFGGVQVGGGVALALGGGAAKGLAHVGVLRGLAEDGVPVTAIAGTSMGSIVGALSARGIDAEEMWALFAAVDWGRLGWIMARSVRGAAFRDLLRETLGGTDIAELKIAFAAVCCDLVTGEEVVLRDGSLEEAVRASSAIPGVLPPVTVNGRTLVDGAMVTPVPHGAAALLSGAPVLAVNVLRPGLPAAAPRPGLGRLLQAAAPSPLLERLEGVLARYRRRLLSRRPELTGRLEVALRATHIMQYNLSRLAPGSGPLIEPEVGRFGWLDFQRAPEIMEAGYRAYREAVVAG